ncbi:MAG: Holliday junction resolvase RuvX [Bacteroidia bacterium]
MGRILAIDFGLKRTGLAWSDTMKIVATGLGSFDTASELEPQIKLMFATETIEKVVLGYPTRLNGEDTHSTAAVRLFKEQLEAWFPETPVVFYDERFTSKLAMEVMVQGGVKKKKRADKQLINQVSATIILQEYLNQF